MPKVMSYNCYAIDWRKVAHTLLYRFHSCNCNNCMGNFSVCHCYDFVGPWESIDLKIVPRPPPTTMQLHKSNMARLLQAVLPVLHSPLFCLARQEHVQWPAILYILPSAKIFPNRIYCYVLEHQNPTTNDFYHTHVVVPAQRDMCNSLKGCCHSPNCFKLHLESFSIASILQLATYKTPAGTFTSCFVQKKTPGHYKFKKTEQAINVFQNYLQTCSILYNDFVAHVIPNVDSNIDFM